MDEFMIFDSIYGLFSKFSLTCKYFSFGVLDQKAYLNIQFKPLIIDKNS